MKTSNTSRSWTDRAKRVLSFCLALAMLLSLMPALTLSASAATPSTLYLVPNSNWKVDNARFAAYFFGNGEKWVDMTDSDKDGVYEVAVPSGYPNVIFCRMSPTASANNWTNKWNQTADLTIPSNGTNCYTVEEGAWDKGGGTWSTVTPEVEETTEATEDDSGTEDTGASYYIAGTFAYGGWNAQNADDKMTNNGDGTYTMVYEGVAAGTQSFKVTDGTWTNCWGGSGTNTDADGNYVFTLSTYSKVTITFTESTKAITVSSQAATAPVVNDVTVHYRNTGSWTTVNAYAWIQGTETTLNGAWPGNALTENADHSNWYTLSLNDLDAEGGIGVIFDNGTAQTGNINITADGEYWYDGELLTEAPDTWEDGSVKTVDYKVTLHFANSKNWGGVYLYTWNDFGTFTGSWPGSALGQGEDGFYSATFTYEAPEGQGVNYIYSGNNQTGDLTLAFSDFTLTDGVYTVERWVVPTDTYKDGDGNTRWNVSVVTDPEAIAISPVVNGTSVTFEYAGATTDTVEVYGTMNDWASGYTMTSNSHGVHSVTIDNVAYGIHQYKIVVNGNWIIDPLNSWIETEANGNQNSAFLISNPEADVNEITINVHYTRTDGAYTGWNVFAWGADNLEDQYDFADVNGEKVATIVLNDGRGVLGLTFKVRKSVGTNDWAEQSGEIYVDLSKIVSGTIDIDITDMTMTGQALNADVVYDNKLSDVELNYTDNTIAITSVQAIADPETELVIKTANGKNIIDSITATGSTYTLTLTETMDLVTLYQYKVYFDGYTYDIGYYSAYATDKFADEFTYEGEDLGATWTESSTTFKVWAPTAESVSVQLYSTGSDEEEGAAELETYAMTKGTKGEWTTTINGNLKNVYYTYVVKVEGETVEAVDPYARTVGVNGDRGMVIDLDSTDPEGWSDTTNDNPNPSTTYTDAIIWELHVRDFSIDADSGVSEAYRGKYLAFTEEGTTVPGTKIKTGIDYIDELGVTHVHLLPVYDYGSVDETTCDTFNWGYDPKNYNAPEGSYSINPYDGNLRVNEYKQMVNAMHNHGISVIMDVVYNHVYNAETFCFNVIVPGYFSRQNSNASGCGNDTASEREMVRKYIVESVLYWAKEYHLDGFRFDLVGLLDVETINQIVTRVHEEVGEDIIFYGEGWDMDGTNREPGTDMAKQHNADKTPGFGYFSDEMRNTLAGSNGSSTGFVSGATGVEGTIVNNIMAKPSTWGSVWTDNPSQIIQYASCHDNYTLIDKLVISTGASGVNSNIIKMNNLAAAIYMNSMGIPFIHAGEEFLREKLEEDGGRCENSYNASDYVNHIEWSVLMDETYSANVEYYKGLIEFRKAHPALRLSTADEVAANVSCLKAEGKVVVMQIDGNNVEGEPSDSILLIYNANSGSTTYTLPSGDWTVCINGTESGNEEIKTVSGNVTVDGISAMVLVQGELENKCSHNYEGVVAAPTCTADGYTTYTCSLCGDSYTGDVVAAKGHSYSDGSCSVCGKADPDYVEPTPDTVTVYFQHSVTTGSTVNAYTWDANGTACTGSWPGTAMTYEGDGLYSIEVPVEAVNIIFNDGTNQTADQTIPYDDRNVFTKNSSDWSGTWDEEVILSQDYYLIGYINGANYGDGEDYANLGDYKFVNGKVTVTFTETSYVCVKNGANTTWYMTDGWAGSVTSVTLHNTSTSSPTGTNYFDKLLVPAGVVTFTLVENNDGTLTLSYTTASSGGETGSADDYYLFGYIDRANYGVEEDSATLGEYKFDEDGKLTTSFKADSYVGVKTGANTGWYQTNGWLGSVTSATLYDSDVYTDFAKYDKLFVPGGVEITFTLVVNDDDTVTLSYEADTTFFEDASGVQDGVTLHAWNWSFDEIADKMDEIAAAGYTAVQTSPIQPLKQSTIAEGQNDVGGHWWVYYQPVDFIINTDTGNALGTKSDFEAMCAVADQYGIKIIVDVVANHLANASGNDLSTAIPSEIRNTAAYWHDYTTNTADYTNRYDITQHCMTGLPDLNTGNQDVQDMVLEFLKECVDAGADGFRFDAAKHIETPEDDTSFASDFWPTVINGVQEYAGDTDLYIYGELLDEPGGALPISAYTKYMAVTDNSWGNTLRGNIAGGTAVLTQGYNKATDASNLVLWAESHDTYANTNGGSTSVSVANINKTWALVAARADAMGLYFVRPENLSTSTLGQSSTIGWKNAEVVAVNKFHNYFAGQSETLDNEDGILYIERGTSGVVLVNVSGSNTVSVTANAMADGTYTDQITGNTFTVANGTISGTIGSTGIAVVYNVVTLNPTIEPEQATLTLEDEVSYNFYCSTQDLNVDLDDMGLLVWNSDPGTAVYGTQDQLYVGLVESQYGWLQATTDPVAAKDMGDTCYYAFYAELADGSYVCSRVFSYSVKKYATSQLSKSSVSADMKALCVALLNYGAAAQEYFAKKGTYSYDTLMNADLTDAHQSLIVEYSSDLVAARVPAETSKVGGFAETTGAYSLRQGTVTLGGKLAINYYFKPVNETTGVTLYYWTSEDYAAASVMTAENATGMLNMEQGDDGIHKGTVGDIAAKDFDKTIYVCAVYESNGTTYSSGVIAYSIGFYCNKKATDSEVGALAQATAVYGYHAKTYFANRDQ